MKSIATVLGLVGGGAASVLAYEFYVPRVSYKYGNQYKTTRNLSVPNDVSNVVLHYKNLHLPMDISELPYNKKFCYERIKFIDLVISTIDKYPYCDPIEEIIYDQNLSVSDFVSELKFRLKDIGSMIIKSRDPLNVAPDIPVEERDKYVKEMEDILDKKFLSRKIKQVEIEKTSNYKRMTYYGNNNNQRIHITYNSDGCIEFSNPTYILTINGPNKIAEGADRYPKDKYQLSKTRWKRAF